MRLKENIFDVNCVISYSTNRNLYIGSDICLNNLKKKVYSMMCKVINANDDVGNKVVSVASPFYQLIVVLITVTKDSLVYFTNLQNLNKDIEDNIISNNTDSKELIVKQLRFLINCCCNPLFHEIINKFNRQICYQIILPLAVSTDKEINDLEESPGEFVNFAIDCIGKQDSKTPKSESFYLFEVMCDFLDRSQFTKHIVHIFTMALEFLVTESTQNQDLSAAFQDLNELGNTYFWAKHTPEKKIEVIL